MASSDTSSRNSIERREALTNRVRLYFVQLTEGCKQESCTNAYCATGSGKPLDQNRAAAAALRYATSRTKGHLCVSADAVGKSPSMNSIIETNYVSTSSSSGITSSSSTNDARQTPEPMDTAEESSISYTDSSEPTISSATPSVTFSDTSSTVEQLGTAASSTLILVTSSASTGDTPPSSPTTSHAPVTSSNEDIQPSSSDVSSSYGVAITSTSSSEMDLTTSDSVSISSADIDSVTSPPRVKFSSSALFKTLTPDDVPYLDEAIIHECIDKAKQAGDHNYRDLATKLWLVFSSQESLNKSFLLSEKERTEISRSTGIYVDLKAVRRAYDTMFNLGLDRLKNTMVNAIDMYRSALQRQATMQPREPPNKAPKCLSHIVILLENPLLHSPEFLKAFPKVLQTVAGLSVPELAILIEWYSHYPTEELQHFISSLQQLITIQLLTSDDSEHTRHYIPQSDTAIAAASGAMIVFYFADLVKAKRAGGMKLLTSSLMSVAAKPKAEFLHEGETPYEQLLAKFQVHPTLLTSAPIPVSEFVNEELNGRVNMMLDYHRETRDSNGDQEFSFIRYPFILNTANKMEKMIRDNLVNMYSERHRAVIHSILTGVPDIPFLLLRINREDIVSDALVQLEAISDLNPIDLRKQLRVDFRGEEGIDEGGLQKEFFQLIVEKLFDPMHGMFLFDESTRQHWFNPLSFEGEEQYRLIGILLGLAIYNNVILDIRFPMVIYRKLIGCPITFEDLYSSHPQIASSLKSMLSFDGPQEEFEDTFMASYQISFTDLFGTVNTHKLKKDGDKIPVTKKNCQEYVDMYTDWLLNKSIAMSFDAFKKGFDLVMSHTFLADLFTAEEVEQLICGCHEWDIDALEESTRYDGFTPSHPVIVSFWQIVRDYSDEQRKQLLAFITGSDRIPVGGLAKLKLVIVKNGPDSDRLPTAHTCFNALMLCEYSTKEKLKERLTIAISYAKGFGMI